MKKKNLKKITGLTLVLVILGLGICLIAGTYAAYNSLAFQRGVVRNRDSEEIRFTSNLLKTYIPSGSSKNYETVLYPFAENTSEEGTLKIPLKIANYLLTNENMVSEKDIVFDLEITLKNYNSESTYTLNGQTISEGKITIPNVTLKGRKPNHADYEIGITGKDLNQLTITAEAKPTSSSSATLGNRILAAYICPCTNSQANPFSYSGDFLNKNAGKPSDYYGYNYEVSISSGRALVTLSWKPEYVKLDPFFLEKLKNRAGNPEGSLKINGQDYIYDKSGGSIQFMMDQTQGEDDYVVLFYPLQDKKDELIVTVYNQWGNMKNIIWVTANEQ